MKLAPFQILSADEIKAIHEATVDILENCGVRLLGARMRGLLKARGLPVDETTGIVRFPRAVLEDAIARAPHQFEVADREGRPAFLLGDGQSKIAAGHNAVFWVDSDTGATRGSTVADVAHFARICDRLEGIHMIGMPVMPQDVKVAAASVPSAVLATVRNSAKPLYFSTDRADVNRTIIDMLAAVFGGNFRDQVYGISQLSPTAPLYWEHTVLEAIEDTLQTGVPIAILPEPNAGVSAPYTLAGLLTVNNAECLSAVAMIQLLKPGHKLLYANSWTTTDMRSGAALVGSTETSMCRIAGAQLARFYRLPCHTTAPNSDNHAHDEQNAWEKTFSTFCAVGAGNDLVVNCGMFATGMTCSHEQLVMDEEISAMACHIQRGIAVSPDTIARDLIKEVGPGGNYLMTEHTLERLHSDEFLWPRVSVRGPRATWEAAGSPDTYRLAQARARELGKTAERPLDAKRDAAMAAVLAQFERR